jgi:hypothetical protein
MDNLLPILASIETLVNQLKNINFAQLEADGAQLEADVAKLGASAAVCAADLSKLVADVQAALNTSQGK